MEKPKCVVPNCENYATMAYGTNWICGKCMIKLIEKEKEEKDRRVLEL